MRTRVVFATAIALGMTVALFAQNPPPPSGQAMAVKTVTVTGCLKPVQPAATATTGTTGTTTMQPKFVLTNLVTAPAGTTGTSGTAAASSVTITEYRLDFDEAKLTPHVGHKIEISGTPVVVTATPPLPATIGTLKVENVKMIAAACP
jgi:hypothetical protein